MDRCAGAISAFAQLDPERVQQAVARLADDLRSGHWLRVTVPCASRKVWISATG